MSRGKYIVIEGPSGVGKSTQISILSEKLKIAGLPTRVFSEPDNQSDLTARTIQAIIQDPSYPVNTPTEVLLYNAARSQFLEVIKQSVANGVYCICDRNYLTTLTNNYYGSRNVSDYESINRIINFAVAGAEPDLTIIMDSPVNVLRSRYLEKGDAEKFDKLGEELLERIRAGYLWEANQRNFPIVFSTNSIVQTANDIWNLVTPVIANRAVSSALAAEPSSIKEIIDEKINILSSKPVNDQVDEKLLSEPIKPFSESSSLEDIVTSITDNIYAFSDKLSPTTITGALARLARSSDDMRRTILARYISNSGNNDKQLKKAILGFGSESIKQLVSQYVVVEDASILLTKIIEHGRLASYVEQSTKYVQFDKKDENGHFRYIVPGNLNSKVRKAYTTKLNEIFNLYSEMVSQLTDFIRSHSDTPEKDQDKIWQIKTKEQAYSTLKAILPVAAKSTVSIYGSSQSIESLVIHLQSDNLKESKDTGLKILNNVRKVAPTFYEETDKPNNGSATINYKLNTDKELSELADKFLPDNYGYNRESVTLSSYYPKNELDLIPDMLYESSNLSLEEIRNEVDGWSMKNKLKVFSAYIGERINKHQKPGRAIEKALYSWDIVSDYDVFRNLQRHKIVNNLSWQKLSPRYGYDTPEVIDDSGLTDKFQECFSISLELYSLMQEAGNQEEAQYATLLGHKMRWQVTYNAREAFHLHELQTRPQNNPASQSLVLEMHEKLSEVHPLIGEAMKFIGK